MNGPEQRQRVMLGVRGMDTDAATSLVTEALHAVPGVLVVEAGTDGQAVVVYDASQATVMDLIRGLRRKGFLAGME